MTIGKNSDVPKRFDLIEMAFKFNALSPLQKDSIGHLIMKLYCNTKLSSNNSNNSVNSKLKSNPDIIITKANKGGQSVLLNKANYIQNIFEIKDGP